jgi:hypothetical protein
LQRIGFLLEEGPLFLDLLVLVEQVACSHQLKAAEYDHLRLL